MNSKEFIDTLNNIILDKDISIASVARKMNKSSQALHKQLCNDDIKLSTLLDIVSALQCDIQITITDRGNRKEYHIQDIADDYFTR